ncbi:hypothetical protein GCM10009836_21900 [Pseudonocardia ailaonensis]|uniref:HTH luxR-type domain-containing protein n=1 Tax=Pseudonocardia ailaonensis TaxID=367279 RepID=A0ABN2MWV2_9PSEU
MTGNEDGDWLEFVADILREPITELPVERVSEMLRRTFDGPRVTTLPAAPPSGSATVHALRRYDGAALLRENATGQQLAFPIGPGPTPRTVVVARREVYGAAEMALAGRIWRLLDGLDRQCRAYAAARRGGSRDAERVATSAELTPRERGVLGLLAEGHTAGAIARRLGIAERTVHKHLERCYAKLGVTDRLTAVLAAQRLGLVAA